MRLSSCTVAVKAGNEVLDPVGFAASESQKRAHVGSALNLTSISH